MFLGWEQIHPSLLKAVLEPNCSFYGVFDKYSRVQVSTVCQWEAFFTGRQQLLMKLDVQMQSVNSQTNTNLGILESLPVIES